MNNEPILYHFSKLKILRLSREYDSFVFEIVQVSFIFKSVQCEYYH